MLFIVMQKTNFPITGLVYLGRQWRSRPALMRLNNQEVKLNAYYKLVLRFSCLYRNATIAIKGIYCVSDKNSSSNASSREK